ncbi:hypothetical protein BJF80_05900 [Serinicoccus sp. CUA-874]|uniref:stage II sporulation protein M n=1 Tax=Serinicoccus sp. CUA-874 TaxID=1517939 RepID=UPI000966D100|nr:stage II sporulation protein M [Serinicoccus sp. CUA-874]OLT16832.1 hypothetical protein BJF80_05900 [Serinicoccus sp. CUA-874]
MSPRNVSHLVSLAVSVLVLGAIAGATYDLHGVITDHAEPGPPPSTGVRFFGQIVLANAGAVALVATGILTAGFGSLILGPVVAANLSILVATGRHWLTTEQFLGGLAIHGTGEALAVLLGMMAGLHPAVRVLTAPRERRTIRSYLRLYLTGIAETVPLLAVALVVIVAAATWETLVSVQLR